MIEKKLIRKSLLISILIVSLLLISSLTFAAEAQTTTQATMCCEKTTYGAYCQNEPSEKCAKGFRQTPTSCEATSFCKKGCCYDSDEGVCMENTPQKVCEQNKGAWSASAQCDIAQCKLGCCVLGEQAAFVSLVRCKKLAGFYGLQADFRTNIASEIECIAVAQAQDRGACIFESDFQKTCKFTTRAECDASKIKTEEKITNTTVSFHKDYLCSAPELGTNCGKTEKTTCVENKDEVYFVDTCGNPANIYDAGKKDNVDYWSKIKSKEESCGFGKDNSGSASCGNCDYFLGSICKKAGATERVSLGDYICRNLDCNVKGKIYKHGESWCEYDGTGDLVDAVGSRHFRHVCYMGEEMIEPCEDFRAKVCIQDKITTEEGDFSQAACRANEWQNCVIQNKTSDCENTEMRDCVWLNGKCVPEFAPGLKFWDETSKDECALGNVVCVVKFEKGLFGGKECVKNCECLKTSWETEKNQICASLGDCGAKINYLNVYTEEGKEVTIKKGKGKTASVIQGMMINVINKITNQNSNSGG